jgi:hypothetical protein
VVYQDDGSSRPLYVSSRRHSLNVVEKLLDCLDDTDRRNPGYIAWSKLHVVLLYALTWTIQADTAYRLSSASWVVMGCDLDARMQSERVAVSILCFTLKMPHVNLA